VDGRLTVRIGIGGWTYEPWRGVFYPDGLVQRRELEYAAQHLTAIEINATFYGRQKPASWRKWGEAVPEGFQFTVKASRYSTARKVLAEGADSIEKFFNQGFTELGDKLGPILWQFMPTKRFDPDDFGAFLTLLPGSVDGVPLRHALEVRHESFDDPAFLDMAREAGVAVVLADHPDYPAIRGHDVGFSYMRLMQAQADEPTGYAADAIGRWTQQAREQAEKGDVFAFFISGAKERNPAAAQAMIAALAASKG